MADTAEDIKDIHSNVRVLTKHKEYIDNTLPKLMQEITICKSNTGSLEQVITSHKRSTIDALSLQAAELNRRMVNMSEALQLCTDLVKKDMYEMSPVDIARLHNES